MKLSIIIVNWNTCDLLKQCLESFSTRNLGIDVEIIVADSGSTDDSVAMLEKNFPNISLIKNSSNLGFAKANNQAIRLARGEYILLLNSDTKVPDASIFKQWVDFMDRHPNAGASGCMLVFPNGKHQVGDAGFKPTLRSVCNHFLFVSRFSPSILRGLFITYIKQPRILKVDWISGAAFMVRKAILSEVGPLNETFFMYAEDIEWGCRIRSFNFDVYYLSHIKIIHLQGASDPSNQLEQTNTLWISNLRDVYRRLNRFHCLAAFDLSLSLGFFLRALGYRLAYWRTNDLLCKRRYTKMLQCFKFTVKNIGRA